MAAEGRLNVNLDNGRDIGARVACKFVGEAVASKSIC
jgi:hypothetical protein